MGQYSYELKPTTAARLLSGADQVWTVLGKPEAVLDIKLAGGRIARGGVRGVLDDAAVKLLVEADVMPTDLVLVLSGMQSVTITLGNLHGLRPKADIDTQAVAGENLSRILAAVATAFPRANAEVDLAEVLGRQLADFYGRREVNLQRLEDLHTKALIAAREERDRWQTEHDQRQAALQASFEQKAAELQRKHAERAEELARREAELDASDARNARRKLLRELRQMLQDRSTKFNVSAGTAAKRRAIIGACALVSVLSLTALTALLWAMLQRVDLGIEGHVGRATATLGLVGSIWYFIRWQNQWFNRHADEEFRLKRLDLDITRASWLVELSMEYGDHQAEMPPLLLEQLSRNLFIEPEQKAPVAHPIEDALTTLLGVSARARLPLPGGGEIELDKASAKQLKKESEG